MCSRSVLLLALGFAYIGLAQESEPRMGRVVTTAATALRAVPDNSAAALLQLPANTNLRWIEGRQKNGFLRVIPDKGPSGWVPAQQSKIVSQPPSAAAGLVEATSPPCVSSLSACPVNGCAAAGTDHAVFNSTKRRVPAATAALTVIEFADLVTLQGKADSLVGQDHELSAADRARLKKMPVKNGTVNEGSLVRINGFLATGPLKPHANTGESVNCRLKNPPNNDFHISLVESKPGTEFQGIVVEMIPQKRPVGWTLGKLAKLQHDRRRVLVTGALFYDNEHVVNNDPSDDLNGQPRRFSLWELHPITSFLVCKDVDGNCDPGKPADWIKLETFQ
jgi:hypothetical protein